MGDTPDDDTPTIDFDGADDPTAGEPATDGDDDGSFTHPDPDEIDSYDMNDYEIDSAIDAVDGDEDRLERLLEQAEKMKAENDEADAEDVVDPDYPDDVAPDPEEVNASGKALAMARETPPEPEPETPDADADADVGVGDEDAESGGESIFSDDEHDDPELEAQVEEMLDLKPVEDLPDDFDYNAQDTSHFGVEYEEITIDHNGIYFKLSTPEKSRYEQMWAKMERARSNLEMIDIVVEYAIELPDDVPKRIDEENWAFPVKLGLGLKCMSFLGLDSFQDF